MSTKVVERKPLTAWERSYVPSILGGLGVTWKHFKRTAPFLGNKPITMEYPEQKWVVPEGYRGAPYLVKDQDGATKCVSCQLCEFVCPPKAIRITPPGAEGQPADRANAAGLAIAFRQADCQATGEADGSVDLVTSTMLVHELPLEALAATLAESARILAPGGVLRFLDFALTGDAFRDLSMAEHGERNNEPFMPATLAADVPAMCAAAGLVNARWVAFDERGAGRLEAQIWPVRREWHFPWAVLEAEKPA